MKIAGAGLAPLTILLILLTACTSAPTSPEEIAQTYLRSATTGQEAEALQLWELEAVGPAEAQELTSQQRAARLEERRLLAQRLTAALAQLGSRITWEDKASHYFQVQGDGIQEVTKPAQANETRIEISLFAVRQGAEALEEPLVFRLWREDEDPWRIIGVASGTEGLEQFLEALEDMV